MQNIVETVCTARVTMARQRPTRNFGWARPMLIDRAVIRDENNWERKKNWGNGGVVFVDLSINLKEDGNQDAFTFINGPELDRVVIRDEIVAERTDRKMETNTIFPRF
ncbi:hypothetical protein DPMN_052891 [Dreissena polymorpha]|uniref:Uncharacterized protein n=1 Tax=Dreissena polymorpha TaxID=45954 RepID=A0A9D4HPQ2_DREPO|nr:hypothetical protein DPMN_052891 [Dreissena polymorpha]